MLDYGTVYSTALGIEWLFRIRLKANTDCPCTGGVLRHPRQSVLNGRSPMQRLLMCQGRSPGVEFCSPASRYAHRVCEDGAASIASYRILHTSLHPSTHAGPVYMTQRGTAVRETAFRARRQRAAQRRYLISHTQYAATAPYVIYTITRSPIEGAYHTIISMSNRVKYRASRLLK